jgi:hypothetical protein
MLQLKNGSSDILDRIDLRQAEEFFLHNNFRVSNADTKTFVLMIPEVTTLAALRDFLGGCASPCRLLHFRSHFIAFPRHVQFGEYIKGGSRLFPLRLAITLFAREQAPSPIAVSQAAPVACSPHCRPFAQSPRIHARRLKLSKFAPLEPDNSDTFVS